MTPKAIRKLAAAIGGRKDPETGRPSSWWKWAIVIVLVLVGTVLVMWWLWRVARKDRDELARLRYEQHKRENEARQARTDAVIETARGEIEAAERRVAEADRRLELIADEREIAERTYHEMLSAIDRIRVVDLPRGQ